MRLASRWNTGGGRFCLALLVAAFGLASGASGQTVVTVSPSSAKILVGMTLQLNATVTGAAKPAVSWSANGIRGGNATVGTITTAGLYTAPASVSSPSTVTVTAASVADPKKSASALLTVYPLLVVTTSSLPGGVVGQAYSATFSASGGTAPYTFSVSAGQLPAGLSLSASGALSGTPTAAGASSFTVQVRAAGGRTATRAYTVSVTSPVSIVTAGLPNGTVGSAYSAAVGASGGTAPYTFSVISGQLPAGLSLSASGTLSGTPAAAGASSFTIQVRDAGGRTASRAFNVLIGTALSITTSTLPNGTVGTAYSAMLSASGGTAPYTFSVASGSLPTRLTLSPSGAISGAPTAAGASSFTVQVRDAGGRTASRAFSVSIVGGLSITTSSLPNGTMGTAYSAMLSAGGGTGPYTWSILSGLLPPGVSLTTNSGALSGTPNAGGEYNVIVQVRDAVGRQASKGLILLVAAVLTITTASLPEAALGVAYLATVTATGGAPLAWSIDSGQLPPGLSLGGGSGTISGIPTSSGSYGFSLAAQDGRMRRATRPFQIRVRPSGSELAVLTNSLHLGYLQQPYEAVLTATGGSAPYTWSIAAEEVPPGLDYNPSTGEIRGVPTQGGRFTITARVTDAASRPASRSFVLEIFEHQLDKYGGLIEKPCGRGPQAHFYTEKMGQRWYLCTPAGNVFWMTSMHVASIPDYLDYQNVRTKDLLTSKYSIGPAVSWGLNWSLQTARRLRSWGFNAYGQYAYLYLFPTTVEGGWRTADKAIPIKLPFMVTIKPSWYALYNQGGYASGPVKDLIDGIKPSVYTGWRAHMCDHFDASFRTWFDAAMLANRSRYTGPNADYVIGFDLEEVDALQGFRAGVDFPTISTGRIAPGYEDPHLTWMLLVTSPLQTASASWKVAYAVPTVHAKRELSRWLSNRYGGSIVNVNAAWGSRYSTFGSTAATYPDEPLGTGDGSQTTFTRTLAHGAVSPHSVSIKVNGVATSGDDGRGRFVVGVSAGTIDYASRTLSITFATAPAAGAAIAVTYATGGFGAGTGLLDEDGTCPSRGVAPCWIPADAFRLAGAPTALMADFDDFLYHYASFYFNTIRSVLTDRAPGILYLGQNPIGSWGTPPRRQILQAASSVVDVLEISAPICPNCTDVQQRFDFIARHGGDKPWLSGFEGYSANADSYMSPYSPPGNFLPTQAARGQLYEERANLLLNAKDADTNTYHFVGLQWWDLYDMMSEKKNWGFITLRDNPYDGVSATAKPGADSWGYPTGCLSTFGCEQGNYGSFTDSVRRGNLESLRLLLGLH